ncbi:ankyrin repeat domain-containing protein, partial [bacterium CPR1]|nr:ankyrin repeat domain-containing protein [bacterium CPR1]
MQALLTRGARVDLKDREGAVALQFACRNGSARLVGALLEVGADPSHRDEAGRTP